MKIIKVLILFFLFTATYLAQEYPFNIEEVQHLIIQGGTIYESGEDKYNVSYPDGSMRLFDTRAKPEIQDKLSTLDTTIIYISQIDTNRFSALFSFWQKVGVSMYFAGRVYAQDLNTNGLPELYGISDQRVGSGSGPVKIYELDSSNVYSNIYTYDSSTVYVFGLTDSFETDKKAIFVRSRLQPLANGPAAYKSDSLNSLPVIFDFLLPFDATQINNFTLLDLDKDGRLDCIFSYSGSTPSVLLAEYKEEIGNFQTVLELPYSVSGHVAGFAIGDFDEDDHLEIIYSSALGDVYILENLGDDRYELVEQFEFPTFNAYMHCVTQDIDGNGKPEFWIGGQNFGTGITMYQAYEAISDNQYQAVARIEIRYSVSITTNYIQAVDLDNDSTEELVISSGNALFIMKFTGSSGNHKYNLCYAKLGEATQPLATIYAAIITDLNEDGLKDILLPFDKVEGDTIRMFSYILKQNKTTSVSGNYITVKDDNFTNFPNPFNSKTNINFTISEAGKSVIRVYNSIGKEIKILLNEELQRGQHDTYWDARDSYGNLVPSGVYLIVVNTGSKNQILKTILLK
jgi:hypothetical protein